MSNDTWIDTKTELPPIRTTVAAVIRGPSIATLRRVTTATGKDSYHGAFGRSLSADQVIAWCRLPEIPEWAKGVQPTQYVTPGEWAKRCVKYDNDVAEAKMTKAPLHVR